MLHWISHILKTRLTKLGKIKETTEYRWVVHIRQHPSWIIHCYSRQHALRNKCRGSKVQNIWKHLACEEKHMNNKEIFLVKGYFWKEWLLSESGYIGHKYEPADIAKMEPWDIQMDLSTGNDAFSVMILNLKSSSNQN